MGGGRWGSGRRAAALRSAPLMNDWLLPQSPRARVVSRPVDDCALSPDGSLLALRYAHPSEARASVAVIDVATGRELVVDEGAPVRAMRFLGDDVLAVARLEGGDVVRLRTIALPDGGALGEALLPDFGDVPLRLDHAPGAATLLVSPLPGWWNTGPLVRTFRTPSLDPVAAINPRRVAAKESKGRAIGASLSPDGRLLLLFGERDYTLRGRGHGLILDARGAVLSTLRPSLEASARDARWIDAATLLTWTRADSRSRTFGLTVHDVVRDLVRYDHTRSRREPSAPALHSVHAVALHPDRQRALLVAHCHGGRSGAQVIEADVREGVGCALRALSLWAEAAAWASDGDGMLVAQPWDDAALRLLLVRGDEARVLWHTDDRRALRGATLEVVGGVALLAWPGEAGRRVAVIDVRGATAG